MTWTLPEAEHEVFARNPLETVICQLRFDPILKIHDRVPELQDRIRGRFPGYEQIDGLNVSFDAAGTPRQRSVRQHRFSARKEPTVALLGDEGASLEYLDHRNRDVLLDDAATLFGALREVYSPVSTTRVGLRYVNLVSQEAISSTLRRRVEWRDLIADRFLELPTGLCDLVDTRYATELRSVLSPGHMTVRLGLLPVPNGELRFRVDVDRYIDDACPEDTTTLLPQFVDDIYRVFRAAAGPALIEWMRQ